MNLLTIYFINLIKITVFFGLEYSVFSSIFLLKFNMRFEHRNPQKIVKS